MSTLDIAAAARLLKCSETTLMRRARAGIVPGAKVGRQWVFIEADLIEFVRSRYKTPIVVNMQTIRSARYEPETSASQLVQEIARKRKQLKKG